MNPNFDEARSRLILALDVDSAADALSLVDRTAEHVGCFKVGLQLFVQEGPDFVRELVRRGADVFLDLKLHDIPNTVLSSARRIAELGVRYFTIHCANGPRGVETCVQGLSSYCEDRGLALPTILGVTVLTSMTDADLHAIGVGSGVTREVEILAGGAYIAGLRSFVASAREAPLLKSLFPDVRLVTPGIRPAGAPLQDQARALTPAEAITNGADLLVVGRPILKAEDPRAAALQLREEIASAL